MPFQICNSNFQFKFLLRRGVEQLRVNVQNGDTSISFYHILSLRRPHDNSIQFQFHARKTTNKAQVSNHQNWKQQLCVLCEVSVRVWTKCLGMICCLKFEYFSSWSNGTQARTWNRLFAFNSKSRCDRTRIVVKFRWNNCIAHTLFSLGMWDLA